MELTTLLSLAYGGFCCVYPYCFRAVGGWQEVKLFLVLFIICSGKPPQKLFGCISYGILQGTWNLCVFSGFTELAQPPLM